MVERAVKLKENEADEASFFKIKTQEKGYSDFIASIKKEILENSASQQVKIINSWVSDQNTYFGVELAHNHSPCHPKSSCQGMVSVHFESKAKGTKDTFCHKCKAETNVDLIHIKLELGKDSLGYLFPE